MAFDKNWTSRYCPTYSSAINIFHKLCSVLSISLKADLKYYQNKILISKILKLGPLGPRIGGV